MLFGSSTNKDDKWIKKLNKTHDPAKQKEAVDHIVGQTALENIARGGFTDNVRELAIGRLEDPKTLLQIAVENVNLMKGSNSYVTRAAGRRYLQVAGPAKFFPAISKLGNNKEKTAVTAVWTLKDDHKALEEALRHANDIEVVRLMSSWMRSYNYAHGFSSDDGFGRICSNRADELEIQAAKQKAMSLTDKQKAAFVKSGSNPTAERQAMAHTIADDEVLASLLSSLDRYDGLLCQDIAEAFTDEQYLEQIAAKLDPQRYQDIYPALMKKCSKYTPEFIIQDKRAPQEEWEKALDPIEDQKILKDVAESVLYPDRIRVKAAKKLGSQELLAGLALSTIYEEPGKEAVAAITDRALLRKIVHESRNIFLRWGAAWRLQDPVLITNVELEAEPKGNGHMVIVTVKKDWEQYEERCIRCGAVYGHEDDSESTTYYGKPFTSFPCRPDMPIL